MRIVEISAGRRPADVAALCAVRRAVCGAGVGLVVPFSATHRRAAQPRSRLVPARPVRGAGARFQFTQKPRDLP